jgi:hypothetical protein
MARTVAAMKTIAYTALHYGSEYLRWAIRSVIDQVDEYWVLYAAQGSHGHHTDVRCPDSRDLLLSLASAAAGPKLRWIDGAWTFEGAQRDSIHQLVPDADVVLVLDADEIWTEAAVESALLFGRYQQARTYRMPMVHYWRSFFRCVVSDLSYPTRVILPKVRSGSEEISRAAQNLPPSGPILINHMGYAQRPVTVGYKQYVHGHKNEWRQDIDWFKDRYLANAQADCHPVAVNYWNPIAVNPADYMPPWMAEHPYIALEVIK